jgi:tetraacyldisaccharide 4'-kinase
VAVCLTFPDHHPYTAQDWQTIINIAAQHRASCLLTTEKDAVRLDPAWVASVPLYVLRLQVTFAPDAAPFHHQLEACIPHAPHC